MIENLPCQQVFDNVTNPYVVAVLKNITGIVRHIPRNIAV